MFLCQWKPSRPYHDPHSDRTRKPKPGNTHNDHARKVGLSPSHSESRKGAPRGRAVPHLAGPSAPNSSSSRKTQLLTIPAPHSTPSHSLGSSWLNDPAFSTDPRSNPHHSMSYYFSASADTGATPSKKQSFNLTDDQHDSYHHKFLLNPSNTSQDPSPEYREKAPIPLIYSRYTSASASAPSLTTSSSTTSQTSTASSTPRTPPTHTTLPAVISTTPRSAMLDTQTTPSFRRADQPAMLPRPATLSGVPRPQRTDVSGIDSARHRVVTHAARPHELDRIDELDETDPLGVPWHHGGPYEAITKFSRAKALQARLDQDGHSQDYAGESGGTRQSHKIRDNVVEYSLDPAAAETPKHDFKPRFLTSRHPLLRKSPIYDISSDNHNRNHSSRLDGQRAATPDMSCQRSTSNDHSRVKNKRAPAKLIRHRKESHDSRQAPDRHFVERASQEVNHSSGEVRSGSHFDTSQETKRHHDDPLEAQHSAVSSIASHAPQLRSLETNNRIPGKSSSSKRQAEDSNVQLERGSSLEIAATHTIFDTTNYLSGSSSGSLGVRTVSTSHRSASIRHRNEAPKPHFLPKRLVMPTPLQPQQGVLQPGSQMSTRSDLHTPGDKSGLQPRAQEIPMQPESRKLVRKRAHAPNTVIIDTRLDMDVEVKASRPNEQRETVPKRVLNKRRNHL